MARLPTMYTRHYELPNRCRVDLRGFESRTFDYMFSGINRALDTRSRTRYYVEPEKR